MQTILGALALAAIVLMAQLMSPKLVRQDSAASVELSFGELSPEVRLLLGRLSNDKSNPGSSIIATKDGAAVNHRDDIARLLKFGFAVKFRHY